MTARLLSLGLLAAACSLGSALVSSTTTATGAGRPAAPKGRHFIEAVPVSARRSCVTPMRRLDRALGAMVAPVRTVVLRSPLRETPSLGGTAYVFPLKAAVPFANTFGAPRPGGVWHHGDDLFAPRGTPVLAVADGVLLSVGWQQLGGRRLWLRDRAGNEFYYAHLDAYAARTFNGQEVRGDDVIAFVGNSGQARQTPPHLHFEIHPASLLGLGYDGAVDPTSYLRSWTRGSRTHRSCGGIGEP